MLSQATHQALEDLRAVGAEVLDVQELDTDDGPEPAIRARVADSTALLHLLVRRTRRAAESDELGAFAARIREAYPTEQERGRAIHAWVRDTVKFRREPGEVFQGGRFTARVRRADCDCQTILAGGIAKAAGLAVRLVPFYAGPDDPRHVCAQFGHDGRWHWAETTIRAEYGEHPIAAAKRLGARERTDIWRPPAR